MGFFGSIGKLAGKVLGAGASKLTMGASDLILKQLKGTGQAKQAAKQVAARQVTQQTQATMAAVPAAERTKVYKKFVDPSGKEWLNKAAYKAAGGKVTKAKKKAPKKAPKKAAKVKKVSSRKPPKGGLDLAAIARAWKAAGKPGTWQGYIKSNPIKKK